MKTRNAKFIEENMIDCEIEHPQYGWIPFTAMPNDTEKSGRDLFEALSSDEATQPLDQEELKERFAGKARTLRDSLLVSLDSVVSNPLRYASFADEEKLELATYRQALLDVPQQANFPFQIQWPQTNLI